MAKPVKLYEAKTRLSELVERAAAQPRFERLPRNIRPQDVIDCNAVVLDKQPVAHLRTSVREARAGDRPNTARPSSARSCRR